tara:strand:+ start:1219 stop:1377 length:159 start_codon:yes stop_codon:yes gene_type:complete
MNCICDEERYVVWVGGVESDYYLDYFTAKKIYLNYIKQGYDDVFVEIIIKGK